MSSVFPAKFLVRSPVSGTQMVLREYLSTKLSIIKDTGSGIQKYYLMVASLAARLGDSNLSLPGVWKGEVFSFALNS